LIAIKHSPHPSSHGLQPQTLLANAHTAGAKVYDEAESSANDSLP
jgi:hypothetical protein